MFKKQTSVSLFTRVVWQLPLTRMSYVRMYIILISDQKNIFNLILIVLHASLHLLFTLISSRTRLTRIIREEHSTKSYKKLWLKYIFVDFGFGVMETVMCMTNFILGIDLYL